MLLELFPFVILNNAMAFVYSVYAYFFSDMPFDNTVKIAESATFIKAPPA